MLDFWEARLATLFYLEQLEVDQRSLVISSEENVGLAAVLASWSLIPVPMEGEKFGAFRDAIRLLIRNLHGLDVCGRIRVGL